ncbi:hypothetical protein [Williamsia sp.]|uniref:hypothetical protein n=1 Tax=Williamsia sp. TaxID=1872085 RepID=UPI001A2A54CA|nr:hypothetical protein [Williamsia sp.]MBJ7287928.1 hypothetical protein [Williamsia sp.]
MNHHFPDSAVVRQAVSLASRAPSARNSQPWAWRVGAQSIDLFLDDIGQPLRSSGDHRDAVISCGIALHHMRVALSAFDWRSVVTRLPDPVNPCHLAHIEVEPRPGTARDVALASAIPRRRTDRRRFATWAVPQDYLDLIELRCADGGAVLRIASSPDADGARLVVEVQDGDASALRAGEATGVVLLEATVLGLASCRLTESPHAPAARDLPRLRLLVPRPVSQVMVKVGWPEANADPLPATPRRGVDLTTVFDPAALTVAAG